jgi:hypothetical protein
MFYLDADQMRCVLTNPRLKCWQLVVSQVTTDADGCKVGGGLPVGAYQGTVPQALPCWYQLVLAK